MGHSYLLFGRVEALYLLLYCILQPAEINATPTPNIHIIRHTHIHT